jgi:DNA-binding PadR family transcriptional regulator
MFGWRAYWESDEEARRCTPPGRRAWRRYGRWAGWGFERGFGGRMFGPGDLRLVLMALIEERPRHGYELMRAIEEAFGGAYSPSPGAIYPTLGLLEDEGLLSSAADPGGKRVYSLTEAGKAWLDENRAAVDGVMQRMRMAARVMSGQIAPDAVREALRTLKQAVAMKPGDWNEDEEARVVEILMGAVRDISRGPAPQ